MHYLLFFILVSSYGFAMPYQSKINRGTVRHVKYALQKRDFPHKQSVLYEIARCDDKCVKRARWFEEEFKNFIGKDPFQKFTKHPGNIYFIEAYLKAVTIYLAGIATACVLADAKAPCFVQYHLLEYALIKGTQDVKPPPSS
jgi:hypothetical protein